MLHVPSLQRTILSLALLLPAWNAWADSGTISALKIHCKSGDAVTILLGERPLVTFANNDLMLTTQTHVVCYPADEVLKFTYLDEDEVITGIGQAHQSGSVFSFVDENLQVKHLVPESAVSVYTVDGKLLVTAQTDAQGSATLALPEVAGGVYVVKTPSVTFKLRKP